MLQRTRDNSVARTTWPNAAPSEGRPGALLHVQAHVSIKHKVVAVWSLAGRLARRLASEQATDRWQSWFAVVLPRISDAYTPARTRARTEMQAFIFRACRPPSCLRLTLAFGCSSLYKRRIAEYANIRLRRVAQTRRAAFATHSINLSRWGWKSGIVVLELSLLVDGTASSSYDLSSAVVSMIDCCDEMKPVLAGDESVGCWEVMCRSWRRSFAGCDERDATGSSRTQTRMVSRSMHVPSTWCGVNTDRHTKQVSVSF